MRWTMVIACAGVLISREALAYIDPGTGSFLLQMLIASLLGALLTMKLWFGAAKSFFRRHFSKTPVEALPPSGENKDPPPHDSSSS